MAFFLLQILSQKTYQEKYLVFFIKIVFAICAIFATISVAICQPFF